MTLRIPALPIPAAGHAELTPLDLRDAAELFRLTDANRDHLRQWLPWLDGVTDAAHTRAFIRAAQGGPDSRAGLQFALRLRGRIVGVVGCCPIDRRNRLAALGYWVAQDHQGLGLVTGACGALLTHAFGGGLNRVEIRCAVDNRRSRAVPMRLGFCQEGVLRDAEWLYDHFVDHAVYAMLARDWDGTPARPAVAAAGAAGDRLRP